MPLLFKDIRYVSDHTKFINELLDKNPEIARGQIEGRALLWDKQVDRDFQKSAAEASVKQKAYVYQPE